MLKSRTSPWRRDSTKSASDKLGAVHGAWFTSDFQALLRRYGIRGSMSRKGNCWDNAVTGTLFGSLKVERLHGMRFDTQRRAKDEVIDWLGFYNHRRMHSTLGYTSPMAFEETWRRQQSTLVA